MRNLENLKSRNRVVNIGAIGTINKKKCDISIQTEYKSPGTESSDGRV